jgi:hypothetical protein
MLGVSTLTWATLHQLIVITAEDILEITAYVGKETEELAQFLEEQFPGILQQLATQYLDVVLLSMPQGVVPSRDEVLALVMELQEVSTPQQEIRDKAVKHFIDRVSMSSPNWAKQCMIAMIEYPLANYVECLNQTAFAECELATPDFEERMASGSHESLQFLLEAERHKAGVLAKIITKRRVVA